MTVIAEKDRSTIRDLLARELVDEVELLLFTGERAPSAMAGVQDSGTGDETAELLDELVGLSDRLSLTRLDVGTNAGLSSRYNVTAVPTVMIRRRHDTTNFDDHAASRGDNADRESPTERETNVRFVGLPGGYEFSTLLADVIDISTGRTDLSAGALAAVHAIGQPVHIQVFVTPT
jgi:alkyl hydroperoxide reductase subunit AhpF